MYTPHINNVFVLKLLCCVTGEGMFEIHYLSPPYIPLLLLLEGHLFLHTFEALHCHCGGGGGPCCCHLAL